MIYNRSFNRNLKISLFSSTTKIIIRKWCYNRENIFFTLFTELECFCYFVELGNLTDNSRIWVLFLHIDNVAAQITWFIKMDFVILQASRKIWWKFIAKVEYVHSLVSGEIAENNPSRDRWHTANWADKSMGLSWWLRYWKKILIRTKAWWTVAISNEGWI